MSSTRTDSTSVSSTVHFSLSKSLPCRIQKRKENKEMHFKRKYVLFCFRAAETIFLSCLLECGGVESCSDCTEL
jgi:hypothetical protein